ncbi:hypothetical protein [Kitasatospora herbaricolor]|uniref:Uncharacterized protein n=1 Tax=Kitasatospora herbaricolor TaxID=68217 RepID=A0ABZ1W1W9_9ACTN|nr:hypothetical protein [Kitasatospora herbaricolor]
MPGARGRPVTGVRPSCRTRLRGSRPRIPPKDLADALAGRDAHPWARVSHAYGPAEDLPDLLRALAEGGGSAEEAISEL